MATFQDYFVLGISILLYRNQLRNYLIGPLNRFVHSAVSIFPQSVLCSHFTNSLVKTIQLVPTKIFTPFTIGKMNILMKIHKINKATTSTRIIDGNVRGGKNEG